MTLDRLLRFSVSRFTSLGSAVVSGQDSGSQQQNQLKLGEAKDRLPWLLFLTDKETERDLDWAQCRDRDAVTGNLYHLSPFPSLLSFSWGKGDSPFFPVSA